MANSEFWFGSVWFGVTGEGKVRFSSGSGFVFNYSIRITASSVNVSPYAVSTFRSIDWLKVNVCPELRRLNTSILAIWNFIFVLMSAVNSTAITDCRGPKKNWRRRRAERYTAGFMSINTLLFNATRPVQPVATRRQPAIVKLLLLIYSFQFRPAFRATTTPNQPRPLPSLTHSWTHLWF